MSSAGHRAWLPACYLLAPLMLLMMMSSCWNCCDGGYLCRCVRGHLLDRQPSSHPAIQPAQPSQAKPNQAQCSSVPWTRRILPQLPRSWVAGLGPATCCGPRLLHPLVRSQNFPIAKLRAQLPCSSCQLFLAHLTLPRSLQSHMVTPFNAHASPSSALSYQTEPPYPPQSVVCCLGRGCSPPSSPTQPTQPSRRPTCIETRLLQDPASASPHAVPEQQPSRPILARRRISLESSVLNFGQTSEPWTPLCHAYSLILWPGY